MRIKSILGLMVCIALVFSLSFAQPANAASAEEEVLQVVTNWYKAQNTNDYDLMSSLWWHSPEATSFNPWKSGTFLCEGWDIISEGVKSGYNQPIGTYTHSMRHPQIMMLGDNVAIITSYNVHTVNPPAIKEATTYLVRGTFVVKKIGGNWLIVHEHSSMIPKE